MDGERWADNLGQCPQTRTSVVARFPARKHKPKDDITVSIMSKNEKMTCNEFAIAFFLTSTDDE